MLESIGIVSSDLPKSRAFYEIFGIEFKPEGGEDHWEALTPSGMRLMLDSSELIKKLNPEWVTPSHGPVVLCFKQKTSQEVDHLFDQVAKSGYETVKEPWDAFWGQRYASVKDPNGVQIDIFADLSH